MNKQKGRHIPVTLAGLNQKLDFESKRLVREREEGVVKRISKIAVLNGNSTLVFRNGAGAKVTLSYRLDAGGTLRFAHEAQPAGNSAQIPKRPPVGQIGRTSKNI